MYLDAVVVKCGDLALVPGIVKVGVGAGFALRSCLFKGLAVVVAELSCSGVELPLIHAVDEICVGHGSIIGKAVVIEGHILLTEQQLKSLLLVDYLAIAEINVLGVV